MTPTQERIECFKDTLERTLAAFEPRKSHSPAIKIHKVEKANKDNLVWDNNKWGIPTTNLSFSSRRLARSWIKAEYR